VESIFARGIVKATISKSLPETNLTTPIKLYRTQRDIIEQKEKMLSK
jgi:hypothetical protein